jgi:hypothetical protein
VFRISRSRPWSPVLDLSTVRETLLYVQDDMRRVPGLEKVAGALEAVVKEIDVAERAQPRPIPTRITETRFLPRGN